MCSTILWARNVSPRWLACARGTALSTASAPPASWTRMAPSLMPPDRRLRRVTSDPTTLATSSRSSPSSSSRWVPWFIGSKESSRRGSGRKDGIEHPRQAFHKVIRHQVAHAWHAILYQRDARLSDPPVQVEDVAQHPVVLTDEGPYPEPSFPRSSKIELAARLPRSEQEHACGGQR